MKSHLHGPWDAALFLASALPFLLWPQLDLYVSALFFDPGAGFSLGKLPIVQGLYRLVGELHWAVLPVLLSAIVLAARRSRLAYIGSRQAVYLLLVLVLGVGFLANAVMKESSGRARPHQVSEFGGSRQFTAALVSAKQCRHNCSFVSGHAAMGFYFISLAWVARRRAWLFIGFGTGALAGLGRILQGGYFLSDVVFAFWLVYLCARLLAWLVLGEAAIRPADRALPLSAGAELN